jgi:hypothetical protein
MLNSSDGISWEKISTSINGSSDLAIPLLRLPLAIFLVRVMAAGGPRSKSLLIPANIYIYMYTYEKKQKKIKKQKKKKKKNEREGQRY